MISTTQGVVINYLKYKDSSIIARVFTRDYGYQSFIINGIRSPRSKRSIADFQSLSLLDLVVYWSDKREIQRLSESKLILPSPAFGSIPKSAMVMFLSDVLSKTILHETHENLSLFELLWQSVKSLNDLKEGFENFHISFLIKLSALLGFDLNDEDEISSLCQGDQNIKSFLDELIHNERQLIRSSHDVRFRALVLILEYYKKHMEHIGEIKSLEVLRKVFHE
jgi:DNA repair protein RecO (recombination protein O)